jgi:hypothetical protein
MRFLDRLEDRRLDSRLMHLVRAGGWSCWFLIALGVVTVLGHVCVEPFHAHAGVITTHEGHDAHDGADETGHDTAHAASCDAVKAQSPAALDVLILDAISAVPPEFAPIQIARADTPAILGSPPPLFLLHAALLI